MSEKENLVLVAKLAGAYGVRGFVRVIPLGTGEALKATKKWLIKKAKMPCVPLEPLELKAHGEGFIARFEDIDSKEQADTMKASVYIHREDFPTLKEKEHWLVDLVGLSVFNREGECLGVVDAVGDNGAQNYLEVINEEAHKTYAIPFVKTYIDKVAEGEKKIYVDWNLLWD